MGYNPLKMKVVGSHGSHDFNPVFFPLESSSAAPVGVITPPQHGETIQVSLLPALQAAPRASLGPMFSVDPIFWGIQHI